MTESGESGGQKVNEEDESERVGGRQRVKDKDKGLKRKRKKKDARKSGGQRVT